MNNKKEIEVVNIQLIALMLTLISTFISSFTTYNQKRSLQGKKAIFSNKELYSITLFNRVLILTLSFVFFYINYELFNISKKEGEDLKPYRLQLIASLFTIISGIIALYVVTLSSSESISDVENPII